MVEEINGSGYKPDEKGDYKTEGGILLTNEAAYHKNSPNRYRLNDLKQTESTNKPTETTTLDAVTPPVDAAHVFDPDLEKSGYDKAAENGTLDILPTSPESDSAALKAQLAELQAKLKALEEALSAEKKNSAQAVEDKEALKEVKEEIAEIKGEEPPETTPPLTDMPAPVEPPSIAPVIVPDEPSVLTEDDGGPGDESSSAGGANVIAPIPAEIPSVPPTPDKPQGKPGFMTRVGNWVAKNGRWLLVPIGLGMVFASHKKETEQIPANQVPGRVVAAQEKNTTLSPTARLEEIDSQKDTGEKYGLTQPIKPEFGRIGYEQEKSANYNTHFVHFLYKWAPSYARKFLGEIAPQDEADFGRFTSFLNQHGIKVASITEVTGSASYEAKLGPQPENIALATSRGDDAYIQTQEMGAQAGVRFENKAGNILATEAEPSQEQIDQMAQIAADHDISPAEIPHTWNHNRGSFSAPEQATLEKIFDNNRSGGAKVEYSIGGRTVDSISLWGFLVALAALIPWGRKKKEKEDKEKPKQDVVVGPVPPPDQDDGIIPIPVEDKQNDGSHLETYGKLEIPPLKPTEINPLIHETKHSGGKEEAAIRDDLLRYWEDEKTLEGGINYEDLADEIFYNRKAAEFSDEDGFVDKNKMEEYLTARILDAWIEHDIKAKQAAEPGQPIDYINNYRNNPSQVDWARTHAHVIVEAVLKMSKLPKEEQSNTNYTDLLQQRLNEIEEAKNKTN